MAEKNIATAPQITKLGRIVAGILLITFTVLAITVLIAFWPDQLPEPGKKCALYRYEWFAMTLDTNACRPVDTLGGTMLSTAPATIITDTAVIDSTAVKAVPVKLQPIVGPHQHSRHIHLNTILLILVAIGGFLGNMIHIATSFTTFIGAGKFNRSWVLWYWVRPFTAAALSLALYFAFGASNDPGNVDLDRILTVAILTGLFTDIATQKLKEVFDVIFAPKDNRPDKLTDPVLKIDSISPDVLTKTGVNRIVIKGKSLKSKSIFVKIDNEPATEMQVTDEEITVSYELSEAAKSRSELVLTITDEEGVPVIPPKTMPVTEHTPLPNGGTQ